MGFGIGIHPESLEAGQNKGTLIEAAVQCWFTATGRAMPLMAKIKNKEEEILKIAPIHIMKTEKKRYAGILTWEYRCRTEMDGREYFFVLQFWPEDCKWTLKI